MKLQKNLALSESGFAFHSSTGDTFLLNDSANFILHLIQSEKNEDEVLESIVDTFEVEKNTAEKDLKDFLSQVRNFNLVE
ncbi:MAG: PqqD family protein [Bacteroidetes bacterium]|nr:PqqD family protein [Bacteroidota bacterium]MBU2585852.1 PqqD family protein [Bacteroidota bacterium]